MSPKHFEYQPLEDLLEAGAVDSREHFYILADARWSHQRRRLISGLFPEHRALFDALPAVSPHRSRQYAAKLDEEKIRKIHFLHRVGEHPRVIAFTFDVSRTTIYDILAGRTWPHLHPNHNRREAS